jgi:NitT/TauT family transport system substrate-binding protein
MRMRRVNFVLGLLFGLLAVTQACFVAAGTELEKVRVSVIPVSAVAPLFVAMKQGYFRELGLEIDLKSATGGATGIPGLIGGSYDIVYGNVVSTLLAAQQQLDVRVVAPGSQIVERSTDTTSIIVKTDSGIKSGKDLEGKSIAVNTRNNVIWLYARAWIKATGGDPERVAFKEIPFPQIEDALRQQRVDAAFVVAPFSVRAVQTPGLMEIAFPYSDIQPGVDTGQYITTGKLLANKLDMITRFAAGLRKGADWYNANRKSDELLNIIAEYTKTDNSILKDIPLQPMPLKSNPDQIRRTMELMIENKLLDTPLNLSTIIAPSAL